MRKKNGKKFQAKNLRAGAQPESSARPPVNGTQPRQAVGQAVRQAGTTLSSVAMTVAHAVVVEAAASRPKTANCGGASNVDLQMCVSVCV